MKNKERIETLKKMEAIVLNNMVAGKQLRAGQLRDIFYKNYSLQNEDGRELNRLYHITHTTRYHLFAFMDRWTDVLTAIATLGQLKVIHENGVTFYKI